MVLFAAFALSVRVIRSKFRIRKRSIIDSSFVLKYRGEFSQLKHLASNNLRRMQRINSQDERVSLRVEGERTPERLQLAADAAARSGDLQTTIEYANGTRQTIQLWDQFRIWDPGD